MLTQSSWEVVSPFPTMLQVLLFFLRCVVPSPSDPDSHSESESDELELEELEESLELSEAMPVDSWRSTASARTASSGCSCFKIRLVPHNREVGAAGKVLGDGNGGVKVEDNMPPAPWYKDSFSWFL